MPQWQVLVRELLPKLDDTLKHELVHWAAFYEHRVQVGSKEIFHLEVRACGTVVAVCFCLSVRSVCGVRVVCVLVCFVVGGCPSLTTPPPPNLLRVPGVLRAVHAALQGLCHQPLRIRHGHGDVMGAW